MGRMAMPNSFTMTRRRYWVVSPNVKPKEKRIADWKRASVVHRAAFMGWEAENYQNGGMGPKFAGVTERGITPDDLILIARRNDGRPEIVGFGLVRGKYARRLKGFKPPSQTFTGSIRKLTNFKACSKVPQGIPVKAILRHTRALVELHPKHDAAHRRVCNWMERRLAADRGTTSLLAEWAQRQPRMNRHPPSPIDIDIVDQPEAHQLDYSYKTERETIRAKRIEAQLLYDYCRWLDSHDRKLTQVRYCRLQCDGFEGRRRNLIEAKASASREHIRMAVGQLLDYAFQGKKKFGSPHKAILLPERPTPNIQEWLDHLHISVIWRQGESFSDNAQRRFI